MPFTFLLNGAHDLEIRNGKFRAVYGADEVKQRILVALRHFWGEYFLDTSDGVPWYEVILGSKDLKTVELILRRKVLEVPGVISVLSLEMLFSSTTPRHLDIYIVAEVQGYDGTVNAGALSLRAVLNISNEFASTSIEFGATGWEFAS